MAKESRPAPDKACMRPSQESEAALERIIQHLLDTTDEELRDQILLDAALGCCGAQTATIYRQLDAPTGNGNEAGAATTWFPIRSRGPVDCAPTDSLVQSALDGESQFELPSGQHVLVAGKEGQRVAVALGGLDASDEGLDWIEALLEVWVQMATPFDALAQSMDAEPHSPLPAGSDGSQIVHDFFNHVGGMRNARDVLEQLAGELEPEERDHYDTVLDRESQLAGDMILQLFAPGSHRAPERDWVSALKDVLFEERSALEELGVQVEAHWSPDLEDLLPSLAPLELSRVFRNLLVNAREAFAGMPNHGNGMRRIQIECFPDRSEHGGLLLCVRDNGPGIPAALLKQLRHTRISTKSQERGEGLCALRSIVEGVGGSVQVKNLPFGGACFQIWIPRSRPRQAA